MSVEKLQEAMKLAISIKPKVGGFPVLAKVLKEFGVKRNLWNLPSCQSIYVMETGNVVVQNHSLVSGINEIPKFNKENLINALRKDQNGESTFQEFLMSSWEAGVTSYDVDFEKNIVIYYGAEGESYFESYQNVEIDL
jgi:uncharacterized protein YbcV (DUF1398 family)